MKSYWKYSEAKTRRIPQNSLTCSYYWFKSLGRVIMNKRSYWTKSRYTFNATRGNSWRNFKLFQLFPSICCQSDRFWYLKSICNYTQAKIFNIVKIRLIITETCFPPRSRDGIEIISLDKPCLPICRPLSGRDGQVDFNLLSCCYSSGGCLVFNFKIWVIKVN